ncbi:hypothetical protein LTR53_003903 [Teratosphaeriaceae sp. CCFEE 6253]|nr:hypothetical protein LTR53_003903 [Teratosphaeriaceae sp. CCFEE 6253]
MAPKYVPCCNVKDFPLITVRPCRFFQLGRCKARDHCPYSHVLDPGFKRRACSHFARGRCHRGETCTFSHAPGDITLLKATTTATEANGSDAVSTEALLKEWRYNIPTPDCISKACPLGPARSRFCKEALDLVGGDPGQVQEVILLLASEGGCLRVKEIAGQPINQLNATQLGRVFNSQILPFLKAITHKSVANSLILRPRLMTIYNIMYGENGQRSALWFAAVAKHLQTLALTRANEDGTADMETADAVETSFAALHRLFEINTEAQVHDELKKVVGSLRLVFEDPPPATVTFAYRLSIKYLSNLEQRCGLGRALPEVKSNVKAANGPAVFDLARERPGELSIDGPRHDNDYVDIRNISILPTLQEIESPRNEYLPIADPQDWHFGGLEGLLDRNFRLLREDTVGQLRDAAKLELEQMHDPHADSRLHQGARTFVYPNVSVSDIAFDSFRGLEFVISFDQPKVFLNMSERQRRDWCEASKRLGHEALICLLSAGGSVAFFIISSAPMHARKDAANGATDLHKHYNLWIDKERAHAVAKPVDQPEIYPIINQLVSGHAEQLSLVEFPGVLLPAFRPTLQAMQSMRGTLDLPFAEILAPSSTTSALDRDVDIGPPTYATRPGFRYDLSAVTSGDAQLYMDPTQSDGDVIDQLTAHSPLDYGQAQAVVSSLSRSLALIQGPPGTGKSFTGVQLIKILLGNKKAGDLGPIICVCYTNHALDQGLERLVDEGTENIVRIGGSSKSARLAEINLREVAQRLDLTKTEKSDRWRLMKELNSESMEINRILAQMGQLNTEASLAMYLENYYPEIHTQLFGGVDEDGWEQVSYHREGAVASWLKAAPWGFGRPRTSKDLQDVHIAHMSGHERRLLHGSWMEEMREVLQDWLRVCISAYNIVKVQLDAIKTELDLRVLRQANIIGVTTSGLARHLDLIRRTGAKVLVCEEAGEVLEAHLLTALLPSVEHAILIGDHQQLRPQIQNYSLSCESKNGSQYSLDVSLFERLIQPQDVMARSLPFDTLAVQRRMHPSIAQLVRKTLYPLLEDAPSTGRSPPVVGMRQRLFWLQHEHMENENSEASASSSRTNDHEASMVTALVKHIVHQGVYNAEDVAVITPYLGQLRKVRAKLSSTFNIVLNDRDVDDLQKDGHDSDGDRVQTEQDRRSPAARGTLLQAVRIATVDNFQGEEAKAVIVSLVRSNPNSNPGFLRTANRINVLLSRAKHGMYIIGNANTMEQVPMWRDVIEILKQDGCFGTTFQLCCPRHEDTPLPVTGPDDFLRLSPEAGCDLACEKQLACGHACVSKCHSDLLHNAVSSNDAQG